MRHKEFFEIFIWKKWRDILFKNSKRMTQTVWAYKEQQKYQGIYNEDAT